MNELRDFEEELIDYFKTPEGAGVNYASEKTEPMVA